MNVSLSKIQPYPLMAACWKAMGMTELISEVMRYAQPIQPYRMAPVLYLLIEFYSKGRESVTSVENITLVFEHMYYEQRKSTLSHEVVTYRVLRIEIIYITVQS